MSALRIVALVFLSLAVGLPAAAAAKAPRDAPREVTVVRIDEAGSAGAELRVRGRPVARVFGAGAWDRMRSAARRLAPPFIGPVVVSVEDFGHTARLLAGGVVVLTVNRSDAAREGIAPVALADRWARALAEALAVPPIAISHPNVVLSPGGVTVVTVTTAVPGAIVLGPFDRQVADVKLDAGQIRITGRQLGGTTARLRFGPYAAQIGIAVRPPAGSVPPVADVVVTGSPAPPELIREAVGRRVHQVVQRDPGATADLGPIAVDALAPGASSSVPVAVRIRSPYGGTVDGTVQVSVTNAPLRLAEPNRLLVSNRPETITGNGLLFHESLAPDHPARLLFHHKNGTPGQPRILKITLSNPRSVRARVHYLSGLAGPSSDPMLIGHLATMRFLVALTAGHGYVVEVPPRSATQFTAYTLAPDALVSGLMQFQVVEGGPVELTVHVRLPWLLDRTVTTDLGPWAFPHPRGTFPGALVEVARDVRVDQPAEVGDLGVMSDLRDMRTGEPLVGDYGVLYRFRLRLSNPTGRQITAALLANAAGGPARGLFLIDGTVADVGLLQANEERTVTSFTLAPGATRDVTMLTMPIAGSFYPVRLAVRPQ